MNKFSDRCRLILASAFGLGLMPIAPGTFGALPGVAMHLAVALLLPEKWQWLALALCFIAVCIAHFWLTPWAQKYWQDSDPSQFVLDEAAGYMVVPLVVTAGPLWVIVLAGFLLFRIIDIIKIPPARQIDRNWHGAWGVLLDDIVSGLYASGLVWVIVLVMN
ncbi:MAG: phosphatidylglycerophosphatase A [Holophagales bacterium]|nr:phosphatidylglycerophosphatase A [Holophagales bacterium]